MWSRKSDCCLRCGTSDDRHGGKGLCMKCYKKDWAIVNEDYLRQYKHKWYESSKSGIDYRERSRKNRNGPVNEILEKFDYKCAECGSKENLHIHHTDHMGHNVPKKFRNNDIDNLQVLCSKCHGKLHGTVVGWSRKHEMCLMCKSKENKHHAHGYCIKCLWKTSKKAN